MASASLVLWEVVRGPGIFGSGPTGPSAGEAAFAAPSVLVLAGGVAGVRDTVLCAAGHELAAAELRSEAEADAEVGTVADGRARAEAPGSGRPPAAET